MPNYRPLASLVWEENEVMDTLGSLYKISKLPPSLHFERDSENKVF